MESTHLEFGRDDMSESMIKFCSKFRRKRMTAEHYAKFVMLCGKQVSDNPNSSPDNRDMTSKILSKRGDVYTIYSEEVFSILDSNDNMDLLKFEEVLVEISDGVIIYLESMGTSAELGAFAYLDSIASKTLVFSDEKFVKDKSFIKGGPLKRIENNSNPEFNLGGVVHTKFLSTGNIDFGNSENYSRIVKFGTPKTISVDKNNLNIIEKEKIVIKPQLLMHYLIDIIFVFEYIRRDSIYQILSRILSGQNLSFEVKFESQNEFNQDNLKQYIIDLLIRWNIITEVESDRNLPTLLKINLENLSRRRKIGESFGKALFTRKMFETSEYLSVKSANRDYINKNYGKTYEL